MNLISSSAGRWWDADATVEEYQFVIDVLRDLAEDDGYPHNFGVRDKYFPERGVCFALDYISGDHLVMNPAVLRWAGYKDLTYPVPPPAEEDLTHGQAYDTLPKWEGEYGENRRQYCDDIADVLEEFLEEARNEANTTNGR